MEVVVLNEPDGDVVGYEEQFGVREGWFALSGDGTVVYRHPNDPQHWPAGTLTEFRRAAEAWDRYNSAVSGRPESEQRKVVCQLQDELRAIGVLTDDGFWSVVAEQAADGLL